VATADDRQKKPLGEKLPEIWHLMNTTLGRNAYLLTPNKITAKIEQGSNLEKHIKD